MATVGLHITHTHLGLLICKVEADSGRCRKDLQYLLGTGRFPKGIVFRVYRLPVTHTPQKKEKKKKKKK
jgi:hypothetical protein